MRPWWWNLGQTHQTLPQIRLGFIVNFIAMSVFLGLSPALSGERMFVVCHGRGGGGLSQETPWCADDHRAPRGSSCTLRLIYMWMLLPFLFQKRGLPSGKLTVCYWKWPFIVDFPIDSMVIFHSHVSLPEGIPPKCPFQWEDVEHPEAMVAWAHFSDKPD